MTGWDVGSFCVKGFQVKASQRSLMWQLMVGVLILEAGLDRPSECPSTKEEAESLGNFHFLWTFKKSTVSKSH